MYLPQCSVRDMVADMEGDQRKLVKTGEFRTPRDYEIVDKRTVMIAALAIALAIAAGLAAQFLTALIGFIANRGRLLE